MDWVFFLLKFLIAFAVMNAGLVITAYVIYGERKVGGHMQARMGPNRAGPIGLFQSFADLLKMLKKENTIPTGADTVVFYAAPVVSSFASLAVLALIPWSPGSLDLFGQTVSWNVADVNVGILVVLALSSLGVYGVIMAGWSSNSKYALLSGLRASSQALSYEIIFGISLVGVFLMSGSLSLVEITNAQNVSHAAAQPGIWFFFLQPIPLITFFTAALAETQRTPFDLVEAESELVSGYHTEYSGMKFGLFQLAEFNGVFTMSVWSAVLFFGGYSSPLGSFFDTGHSLAGIPVISGLLGSGVLWLATKAFLFVFIFYWLRWTLPRFRYDQLMGLCWKVFLPVVLLNIMVLSVLKLIFFEPGLNVAGNGNAQIFWWILAIIELVFGAAMILGFSRLSGMGWFGRAERPVLVERPLIMVRTVHGGRGTIDGDARVIQRILGDRE